MSGCTGHCCRSFTLGTPALDTLTHPDDTGEDAQQIRDMVIELEWCEDGPYVRCTCRHFAPQTGQCTNYDNRPGMCRRHGQEYPCPFDECTLTAEERFTEKPSVEAVTES